MTNLITITSVPAEVVPEGKLQIVARWKTTEAVTVPAANKQRAVLIPADMWKADIAHEDNRSFQLFISDAVEELAKDYLTAIVRDSNWLRTEVNEDAFSLSSLLSWNAERAALAGRLNSEQIKQWITKSATVAAVKVAHSDKVAEALAAQFVKLAGPNHGVTQEKATKILSALWKEEDADDNTGLRVYMKLKSISEKKAEATEDLLASIL